MPMVERTCGGWGGTAIARFCNDLHSWMSLVHSLGAGILIHMEKTASANRSTNKPPG